MAETFEPVFSGFHHARGQRTFAGGNDALFPANHTRNVSWAGMFVYPYNPLHPPLRDGILEAAMATGYEDLSTVLYNVKEWRFEGSVGDFTFNCTVPAGCYGDYESADPPTITDTPNDGARGIYAVRFDFYDQALTETTGESVSVSVGIGANASTQAPVDVWETISPSSLNPYTFIPWLDIQMVHSFSDDNAPESDFNRIINAEPNTTPVPVEDENITFLGLPVYTHPLGDDGPPTAYSLAITVESFWTTDDEWVRHW